METFKVIRDKAIEHFLPMLFGLVSIPTLLIYWAELVSFLTRTLFQSHPEITTGLIILLFVLIILESAYILLIRKRLKKSITKRFGIHWDYHLNPISPNCDKLLQHPKVGGLKINLGLSKEMATALFNKPTLKCSGCIKDHMLVDDNGNQLSLLEAKKLLK